MNTDTLLHWTSFMLGVGAGGFVEAVTIVGPNAWEGRFCLLTLVFLFGLWWAIIITRGEKHKEAGKDGKE